MISKITNYIVNQFQQDELVHTISLEAIDVKKENIYPLVALKYNGEDENEDGSLLYHDYTIHILQQRDSNRKMKPSKLLEETNWIDNLNECSSIANNFINYIRRLEINENINVVTVSKKEPLSGFGGANLDGFVFDITFSMPNTGYCGT